MSFSVSGVRRLQFDWQATQRNVAATVIPIVLAELKRNAPVSASKPDAGRFRDSIGYRIDSGFGKFTIKFVSTASYAPYVLYPTQGGTLIEPVNTFALRYANGFGDYVFASSVIRGDTPGNDFNIRVKEKLERRIRAMFSGSFVTIYTKR